jgi:tetratricopeptide (TPR) repeat protein
VLRLAAALLAVTLLARPAAADQAPSGSPTAPDTNFWAQLIDPYAEEVRVAVQMARQNLMQAVGYAPYFDAVSVDHRDRLLADAWGMLQYARKLSPDDPGLLLALGIAADELGHTGEARRALERYLEVEVPERLQSEGHMRLGVLYARLGEWDRAVSQLKVALSRPLTYPLTHAEVLFSLASVYMNQGRLAEAIDVLVHEPSQQLQVHGLVQLTLAVAYDRDEQLTQAYDVLDRLLSIATQEQIVQFLIDQSAANAVFTPAADRFYFRALVYEAAGFMGEARAEWQHYAASAGARYRSRALAHVAAIDALLEDEVSVPKQTPAAIAPIYRHPAGRPGP